MIAAVLPASGKAERFGGIPKFLLPVGDDGQCLLDFQIHGLVGLVDHVVVTTQRQYFELVQARRPNWPESLNVKLIENEPSTMPQAFLRAASEFPSLNYLCLFPDTYFQTENGGGGKPLEQFVSQARTSPNTLALALWEIAVHQYGFLGQVDLEMASGTVVGVSDKDPDCNFPLAWGAFYLPNELLKSVHPEDSHMGLTFNRVINGGNIVNGFQVQGRYWDLANIRSYRSLLAELFPTSSSTRNRV